jgi:hypothetical protein
MIQNILSHRAFNGNRDNVQPNNICTRVGKVCTRVGKGYARVGKVSTRVGKTKSKLTHDNYSGSENYMK